MDIPHNVCLLMLLLTLKTDTAMSVEPRGECEVTLDTSTNLCVANVACTIATVNITHLLLNFQECQSQTYQYDDYGERYDALTDQIDLRLMLANLSSTGDPLSKITPVEHFVKSITITNSTLIPLRLHEFRHLIGVNIVYNTIEHITLNNFKALPALNYINASHNLISKLDTGLEDDNTIGHGTVRTIDLSYNNIEIVPNNCFIYFGKLQHLNLSYNSISDLEIMAFEGTPEMLTLQLSHNKLHSVGHSLTRFFNLRELSLDGNSLISIVEHNFVSMSKLQMLNLSSNRLKDIEDKSFQNLHSLTEIDLSYNEISAIRRTFFRNTTKLHSVALANNYIKTIESDSFKGKNITKFTLEQNSLTGLLEEGTFEGMFLDSLDLSGNRLTALGPEVFRHSRILSLNLSSNLIYNISKSAFKHLDLLTELDVSNNELSSIDLNTTTLKDLSVFYVQNNTIKKITKNMFKNFTSLTKLHLFHNDISELEPRAFQDQKNTISSIKELYLNNNKITILKCEIFYGLNHLQVLNLASNNIIMIESEAFRTLASLNILDLSSNVNLEIGDNFFDNLPSLSVVSLKYNKIPINFEQARTTSINQLDLSTCSIANINPIFIFKVIDLSNLDLSRNNIASIDKLSFQEMSSLIWLDLSFNLISLIQPGAFHKTNFIKTLNLHDNEITELQFGVLDGLERLQTLNLSNNVLHSFDVDLLHNIPRMNTIVLDDNDIEYLKFEDFTHKGLNKITIGGNPIPCRVFVDLKNNEYPFHVTAETLDFHSENVKGVTCISKVNKSFTWPLPNNAGINSSHIFIALRTAIDNLRISIENLNNRTIFNDNDIVNNKSQLRVYNKSMLMEYQMRNQMITEHKMMYQDEIIGNGKIEVSLYVIVLCLLVMTVVTIICVYSFLKYRSRLTCGLGVHSSKQPITNVMEMHE